jgi:adenosylhomocysteine nucleosidase
MVIPTTRVAIVAALDREIRPLIKRWRITNREYDDRNLRFFESDQAVLICGGIGAEAARRACEAVIKLYQPSLVISAGFAGALGPEVEVGRTLTPRLVIDANDGSRTEVGSGSGVLVSFNAVADARQKLKLGKAYRADAVDMEAAAVARGADAHRIPFVAVKAISDEAGFEMPALDKFIARNGQFQTGRFVLFAAVRPWLWPGVIRLRANMQKASSALCLALEEYTNDAEAVKQSEAGLHPISKIGS